MHLPRFLFSLPGAVVRGQQVAERYDLREKMIVCFGHTVRETIFKFLEIGGMCPPNPPEKQKKENRRQNRGDGRILLLGAPEPSPVLAVDTSCADSGAGIATVAVERATA